MGEVFGKAEIWPIDSLFFRRFEWSFFFLIASFQEIFIPDVDWFFPSGVTVQLGQMVVLSYVFYEHFSIIAREISSLTTGVSRKHGNILHMF